MTATRCGFPTVRSSTAWLTSALNAGHDPDAEHRPLPAGLAGALGLRRVGVFGNSLPGRDGYGAFSAFRRRRGGGYCGTCETRVLAGTPLRRDTVLSDAERETGDTMMICVSRSRTPLLALDH